MDKKEKKSLPEPRTYIVRHPLVKQIVEAFDRSAAVEAAPAPETGK